MLASVHTTPVHIYTCYCVTCCFHICTYVHTCSYGAIQHRLYMYVCMFVRTVCIWSGLQFPSNQSEGFIGSLLATGVGWSSKGRPMNGSQLPVNKSYLPNNIGCIWPCISFTTITCTLMYTILFCVAIRVYALHEILTLICYYSHCDSLTL